MLNKNLIRFVLPFIFTVAVLFGLNTFKPIVIAQIPVNLVEKAKAEVFRTTGISPNRLIVGNTVSLANTGIKRFKVTDPQGTIHSVALDAAGNVVSQEVVNQIVEKLSNRGFFGKLEVGLDKLIKSGSDSPIDVVISLEQEVFQPFHGTSDEEYKTYLNNLRSFYAKVQQPLVEQLKADGQQVTYQSLYTPMITARVTPSVIEKITSRADVKRMYIEKISKPRLNTSRIVVQANTVNSRGFTGGPQQRPVAIVEVGRIASHPNLPANQRSLCNSNATTGITAHKTMVAGIIQSTHATYKGITPDIDIIDGIASKLTDGPLIAATDCVVGTASIINMSFGFDTNGDFSDAFTEYVDDLVYSTGATIVVSASNRCDLKPGSPDLAFNVINVGSFGDNNTTSFTDDIVPCTNGIAGSYLNPASPNSDREEPDVVAPGVGIKTTNLNGSFQDADPPTGGTSFAAPHVTAGIGLLNQRKPDLYYSAAEARAIIMASARHNLEGSSRLSDRDGVGGIMLAAADTVVANGQSDFLFNDGNVSNFPISKSFTATNGQKVRVVITWTHKMPLGEGQSRVTTDLDLNVYCGNTFIGSSESYDNNFEIVEFTAGSCSSGYTALIHNLRASVGYEAIGFAVSKTDT
ncbi:S8 family serine peptidase [Nostoc sp. CHAB 5844]|nr:S8 family serine peptidase [Nostoc sp. CHAB 5844]